jgi:hypothetical protein
MEGILGEGKSSCGVGVEAENREIGDMVKRC